MNRTGAERERACVGPVPSTEALTRSKFNLLPHTHMRFAGREFLDSEDGAILILLAVLAAALFAFIALGIDIGLLSISRRDHSSLAPTSASAALDAFAAADPTLSFDDRMEIARRRAEEVAQTGIDAASTTRFYKGRGYTVELSSDPDNPGATGFIEAGIWHFLPTFRAPYFDETTNECIIRNDEKCPCADDGTWNGPCFEPLNADPDRVTSMRIRLTSREDAPLQARFAGTFGGRTNFYLASSAIVATRPLRMVILFDLSRSAHQETHLPFEMVGVMDNEPGNVFNASEYAFRLANKSCAAGEPTPPNNGTTADTAYVTSQLTCKPIAGTCGSTTRNPPLGPSDCRLRGGLAFSSLEGAYDALFNFCSPIVYPPGKVAASVATWRSKADYRCVDVTPTVNGTALPTASYLVDAFRSPTVKGPEPMTTLLSGIRRSLERFEMRDIDGDRIAVIGFDQDAEIDQRTFPLVEPRVGNGGYDLLKQVFAANADFYLRHQDHMWFPREDAMSNIPDALRAAYTMLTADPEFHFSENHVILISDGVSECVTDDVDGSHRCTPNQATIEESLGESLELVQDFFADSNIRFNVLLAGELAQPHSLVKKGATPSSANRCMTEDEARNIIDASDNPEPWVNTDNDASYRDVTHDAYFDSDKDALAFPEDSTAVRDPRFRAPNRLHEAVRLTGGVWGTIRPACAPLAAQLSGGRSCNDGGFEDYLDEQCAALGTAGELLPGLRGMDNERLVDGEGRLVCDPLCRSREEQIEAFIDRVFDTQPYLAVDSNIQVH